MSSSALSGMFGGETRSLPLHMRIAQCADVALAAGDTRRAAALVEKMYRILDALNASEPDGPPTLPH